VGKYARDINANALAQMHWRKCTGANALASTHPDLASLVDPLSGKPERG